jgi:GNAT superfamily N-acetyltransferase
MGHDVIKRRLFAAQLSLTIIGQRAMCRHPMKNSRPPDPKPLCEIETELSDGRSVCLRSIRPSDEARIREGIKEMSDRSRYFRFFSAFREAPESIVKQLSAVDGHDHIGWGAILLDGENYPAIGAAHAIRNENDPDRGELAIALLDEYHGCGLARMLIAAVLVVCRNEGIASLEMQVLGENHAAASLFSELGAQRKPALDSVMHYQLNVADTLLHLGQIKHPIGICEVLAALRVQSK